MDPRALLSLLEGVAEEDMRARLRSSLLFAEEPPGAKPPDEVEERFASTVRRIAERSPDHRIGDFFLMGREWEGFRDFIKATVLSRESVAVGRPREEEGSGEGFEAALRAEVEDEAMKPFAAAASRITSELPREGDQAGWIDRVVDAHEAASLVRVADRLGSADLRGWAVTWANLRAGLSLVRARRLGWDAEELCGHWHAVGFDDPSLADLARGDEGGWPSALRKLGLRDPEGVLGGPEETVRLARRIDETVSASAAAAAGMPFGPERVFAFLWALRCEAMNLRVVLSAAALAIPPARIENELRTGYG